MQKKIENTIKGLVVLTFVSPWLAMIKSFIFPFIVPKILFFRILVLLMLGCYILLLYINWEKYRPKLNILNIAVLLFYFSFAISTFVGVDWYRSFWDNHERMLGLFTITHYVLYYFILTSVFTRWDDWKWFLRLFLGAGSVVMFIGVLQRFVNPDLIMNKGTRVFGTLGNAIYYSGYGLFLMFIGVSLALKESVDFRSKWFWYSIIGAFLGFLGIFLGGTRGALLGLLVGLFVLCVLYALVSKSNKKFRIGLLLIVFLGIILFGGLYANRKTDFVRNIPAVGRLLNTTIDSSNTRVMAWEIALEAWQEKPIFGWGPNNYYYAFNKYYRAEFLEHGWGETWFDNAHGVLTNTLAVQGLVGLLSYLSMYVIAIFIIWHFYKKEKLDLNTAVISSSFLVAHLFTLLTVFENPTSYLYFFFILAFIESFFKKNDLKNSTDIRNISWGLIGIVFAFIFLLIYSTNVNPARANTTTLKALKSLQGQKYPGSETPIDFYNKANEYPSPHIDDIRFDFSKITLQVLSRIESSQFKNDLIELVDSELNKNIELHPLDIRMYMQKADLALIKVQLENNVSYLYDAEKYLEDALSKSPERQQVIYQLGVVKNALGKKDEAVKLFRKSIEDDYKISDGWWRLASLYMSNGEMQNAIDLVEEAEERGVVFKGQGKKVTDEILNLTTTSS